MTRRDAAVLVLVGGGLYCLLVSIEYLSSLVAMFDPPVSYPKDWSPAIYFASYLIPFAILLAAGQVLIRGRHAFAQEIFPVAPAAPPPESQLARIRAFGSLAFTVLGLWALSLGIHQLPAIIQVLQPYSWRSAGIVRVAFVSVLHPLVLAAYVLLGCYLIARRNALVERWLIVGETTPDGDRLRRATLERTVFRVVGLWFMMIALRPLSGALVRLIAHGLPSASVGAWDFWPDALRGILQLLLGLGVFLGRTGMVAAWRRVVGLRAM